MFKLAASRGSCEGLYCGPEGVYLGSAALIERREGGHRPRADAEIAELLAAAYDPAPDCADVAAGLQKIAAALEQQDLTLAMIYALQLRLGEISDAGVARVARAESRLKHNFNPDEPRDSHGRWTSEDSSDPPLVPASARRPSAASRAWEHFPNSEFRNSLAIAEGSADKPYYGYREIGRSGALGRYQMTLNGLVSAGMTDIRGNWTGKYGIHSRARPSQPSARPRSASDPCCRATRASSPPPRGSGTTLPATSSAAASSTAVAKSP